MMRPRNYIPYGQPGHEDPCEQARRELAEVWRRPEIYDCGEREQPDDEGGMSVAVFALFAAPLAVLVVGAVVFKIVSG